MEPVNIAYKLDIEGGMWGIIDAIAHVEAAIAQHPDATRRDQLKRDLMQLEAEHSKAFVQFLSYVDRELDEIELEK